MSALPIGDFGPVVHGVAVDRAVLTVLRRWLPTYMTQIERMENKPTRWLARPRAFGTTYVEEDEDYFSDTRMPTVLATTGDATEWQQTGDRTYMAIYQTAITFVVRGRSMPEARLQAALSIAAVTDILLDKPSLEGIANGVTVVSERIMPIDDPSNRTRHMCAGLGMYEILVADIRRGLHGPLEIEPPPDPDTDYDPYPPVSDFEYEFDGQSPATPLED